MAIFAEIDSITRSKVDSMFENSGSDTLRVGEVFFSHPGQGNCHFGSCMSIEAVEPSGVKDCNL